ncbi:hypothetical protein BGW80DRAFT_1449885 [Lactifluus volemus]|nr:hypothetical protein BGW80DRAFT_1449885 [Lactifluus volemus]
MGMGAPQPGARNGMGLDLLLCEGEGRIWDGLWDSPQGGSGSGSHGEVRGAERQSDVELAHVPIPCQRMREPHHGGAGGHSHQWVEKQRMRKRGKVLKTHLQCLVQKKPPHNRPTSTLDHHLTLLYARLGEVSCESATVEEGGGAETEAIWCLALEKKLINETAVKVDPPLASRPAAWEGQRLEAGDNNSGMRSGTLEEQERRGGEAQLGGRDSRISVGSIQASRAAEERLRGHFEKEMKKEEMYASESAQRKVDLTNNYK